MAETSMEESLEYASGLLERTVWELEQEKARCAEQTGTIERLGKLVAAYVEYVSLYDEELLELVGLAAAHGWKSTHAAAGIECRRKIAALEKTNE